ncbi:MAG: hypothetical protein ABIQ35_01775, partial [Verrucomicrobiota bacterium]
RKINRASGAAVSRILVLPWLVFFLSLTILGALSFLARIGWNAHYILLYWFALSVGNNVIFISWAKKNLLRRFRDVATQRFDAKTPRFPWLKSRAISATADLPPVIHLR